jgi:hypothetical protein
MTEEDEDEEAAAAAFVANFPPVDDSLKPAHNLKTIEPLNKIVVDRHVRGPVRCALVSRQLSDPLRR